MEQIISINTYVYHMPHGTAVNEKRGYELEKDQGGYMKGFGGQSGWKRYVYYNLYNQQKCAIRPLYSPTN